MIVVDVCVWDVRVCLGFDVCFFWMIMDVFSSIHILLLVLTCAFYTIYTLQHFNFIVVLSWRGKIQTQVFLRKKVAEAMSFEVFNMHVWHCLLGSSRFKIGAFALVYVVVVPTPCLWEFDWRQIHIHVHISLHIFTYCVYFLKYIHTYGFLFVHHNVSLNWTCLNIHIIRQSKRESCWISEFARDKSGAMTFAGLTRYMLGSEPFFITCLFSFWMHSKSKSHPL